jgi:hypothetical protein
MKPEKSLNYPHFSNESPALSKPNKKFKIIIIKFIAKFRNNDENQFITQRGTQQNLIYR